MKKGFTLVELIGVIIILALIMLLAVPPILNSIRSTRNELSDASKKIIYTAANLYVSENLNDFPKYDGNTFCVSIDTLSKKEYLPTIVYDSATGDEIPKDSLVEIKVENNNYTYNMNNECVEYIYDPYSLINILLKQYSEGNTKGLVKDATNENLYYYTGLNREVTNNYLWYGGHQWRVLEFDTSAKTLTLISQQPLTAIQPASSVWTTQSAYESSYINTWLNDYFYNSLDSSIQSNIQKTTFNIGIYTDVDEITTEQKVGMLDEDQYERAGSADSFLDIKDYWWLENRYSSSSVRYVYSDGSLYSGSPSFAYGVRAVIKISDLTITGGDGTLASNYQVGTKATNTNNVQIGEYINVPYSGDDSACGSDNMCTFRVVSKDSDSIKVVLNGLLPTTSKYGSSTTISTSHTIYTPLNAFATGISDTYRYTGNKTFYIGDYPYVSGTGQNYEYVQDETLQASVGLPTVGEMFSGNDIDLSTSSTKIFVDVNTIENPTVSSDYWTMNRYSSSYVRYVYDNGALSNISLSNARGVRAVIYLKNNLELTGEGTAQSPYEIVPPPIESFSFAEDSWETIAKNIRNGKADEYYSVGDTKDVTLSGYGTFKVRIANLSRPESCTTWNYSQTACGFVIEFVDIITNHVSLVNGSTMYGWPQSELHRFLNEDIYSALPKDLQNIIIDTNVVSGYDIYAENNYYSNDKLYLLSSVEIGNADDSDSVTDTSTRRLDYYTFYETSGASIRMKKYNGEVTRWWLRSPDKYNSSFYSFVNESGSVFNRHSLDDEYGLAPAFRIG